MLTSPGPLSVEVSEAGAGRRFIIAQSNGESHVDRSSGRGQNDYLDLFARLAPILATRVPRNRQQRILRKPLSCHRPLLTRNIAPGVLYGYGDPSVLRIGEDGPWYAVVTSNDAPDSFPILRSADLEAWEHVGFVFPEGLQPAWAKTGLGISDFWAPELHKVGSDYLACFAARERDDTMSIAIARAKSPLGPFTIPEHTLVRGGVIDAHLFVMPDSEPLLIWKEDSNGVWPERLVEMINLDATLAQQLFDSEEDQRTAALTVALWRTARRWPPMEQFFVLQPLIEAVIDSFAEVRRRLARLPHRAAVAVLEAMRTPIFAQRMTGDCSGLLGTPEIVLENDLEWEAHLIEGPWLTQQDGRFYMFYSGNDFSTHEYGIGVAVSETPFGPFRKMAEPLLRSDERWLGPGHPSVALGRAGQPQLFYHAFDPKRVGYNEFRALLTCGLRFRPDGVDVCEPFPPGPAAGSPMSSAG